jgi:hypothetical protein
MNPAIFMRKNFSFNLLARNNIVEFYVMPTVKGKNAKLKL